MKITQKEEEMKYEEETYDSRSSWLLSFILGRLVGAAVALLMAPKPGTQTREQLRDLATDAKGKAEGYYGQVKEKVHTAVEKGKETYETKKTDIQEAMEKGIEKGREVFHQTKEAAKEE